MEKNRQAGFSYGILTGSNPNTNDGGIFLKLNYKRTMLVGLAFFSISAFWLMYDNYIPLILEKTFDLQAGPVGIIMAIDNILALILLPVFGALSDKAGRRMPFILIGTFLAAGLTGPCTHRPSHHESQQRPKPAAQPAMEGAV